MHSHRLFDFWPDLATVVLVVAMVRQKTANDPFAAPSAMNKIWTACTDAYNSFRATICYIKPSGSITGSNELTPWVSSHWLVITQKHNRLKKYFWWHLLSNIFSLLSLNSDFCFPSFKLNCFNSKAMRIQIFEAFNFGSIWYVGKCQKQMPTTQSKCGSQTKIDLLVAFSVADIFFSEWRMSMSSIILQYKAV